MILVVTFLFSLWILSLQIAKVRAKSGKRVPTPTQIIETGSSTFETKNSYFDIRLLGWDNLEAYNNAIEVGMANPRKGEKVIMGLKVPTSVGTK